MTAILGVSAFYHDSAAALVVDGRIVAAAQEERFSRRKHDSGMPVQAIQYCLGEAGLTAAELDYVGFYDKPLLKLERLLETYLGYAPRGFRQFAQAMPSWLGQKLAIPRALARALGGGYRRRVVFAEHHESHAASAFFPSPCRKAAIVTVDGVGEWATASIACGEGNRIRLLEELHFPHSLGLLYSAFTYYAGFAVNDGEYKLMGLAPYGEPKYVDSILGQMMDLKADGSFRLNLDYFNYCHGLTMTSEAFHRLFGGPPRHAEEPIAERHMDAAASIQRVTEEVVLRMARHAHQVTGLDELCLAGGVALNCVANGRILREGPFRRIWVQPASGDAGGALGVALLIWHQLLDAPREPEATDSQRGSLLGEGFDDDAIGAFLESVNAVYRRVDDLEALLSEVATALAHGHVVGWFQGRMEFGPRALGARSILADARVPSMQSALNQKIKFREGFRPFAPVVLEEHAHEYFELGPGQPSPYMLLVAKVAASQRLPDGAGETVSGLARLKQQRSRIPAVTHVDDSARIQTVGPDAGLLRPLLQRFRAMTGCPVLVNTSLNLSHTPIARTPRDAYETFMGSAMDWLCLGRFLLKKSEQPAHLSPLIDELRCPQCGVELASKENALGCARCQRDFAVDRGIPRLLIPGAADPERTPLPDDSLPGSVRALLELGRRDRFARRLDESIAYNSSVLDVGCRTGQLAAFLAASCRRVVGMDVSLAGLRLAEQFRRAQGLRRVLFVQGDLLHPPFAPASFDVVLCGVLHHLRDPAAGLGRVAALVKRGGHVVLRLRRRYAAPGEVLEWFDRCGLCWVGAWPPLRLTDDQDGTGSLFDPQPWGTRLERWSAEVAFVACGGGRFVMIGRRP